MGMFPPNSRLTSCLLSKPRGKRKYPYIKTEGRAPASLGHVARDSQTLSVETPPQAQGGKEGQVTVSIAEVKGCKMDGDRHHFTKVIKVKVNP